MNAWRNVWFLIVLQKTKVQKGIHYKKDFLEEFNFIFIVVLSKSVDRDDEREIVRDLKIKYYILLTLNTFVPSRMKILLSFSATVF